MSRNRNRSQSNNQQDKIVNNSDLDKIKQQYDDLNKQCYDLTEKYQRIETKYQEAQITIEKAKRIEKDVQEMQEKINLDSKNLKNLKNEIEHAQRQNDDLNKKNAHLQKENQNLQEETKNLQRTYSSLTNDLKEAKETIANAQENARQMRKRAEEEAENLKEVAYEEADEIREKAHKEADKLKKDAHDATMSTWQEQSDELESQRVEIREQNIKLQNEKNAFEEYKNNKELEISQRKQELESQFQAKERKLDEEYHKKNRELDSQEEDIKEQKELIQQQKAKYDTASPDRLASLQEELELEKEKYNNLNEKYQEQGTTLQEYQRYMDKINSEMEDPEREDGSYYTLNEVVRKLQEVTKEYKQLKEICKDYPTYEEIEALKKKADRVVALEREKEALEEACGHYQSELQAHENSQRSLEVIQQQVVATETINKNLLQELNSIKFALENHAGDPCLSLSKVDTEVKEEKFVKDIAQRKNNPKLSSLRQIVTHVKDYAGSNELYYSDNDIRAFLAGMAVSRLIILQGMSGTGKSSLPRIFAEAISGFNRLIPVESCWRDRNELLGYYNDFNKKFNAKDFTKELYRSSKEDCQEIPTFITLDEMNLARIEYYFSDFLAILQDPKSENWIISLVPFDMRTIPMTLPKSVEENMQKNEASLYEIWEKIKRSRKGDLKIEVTDEEKNNLHAYLDELDLLLGAKDLKDGHNIQVTDNIWFVGTANKDESTFEITDKVYDRAQVISLNEKGKPESKGYNPTSEKYISVETLISLFDEVIDKDNNQNYNEVKDEVTEKLEELDDCLREYFDTSFGNRILEQTINFVAVFKKAGGTLEDALDYQISTKILRKVITSDNENAFLELQKIVDAYPKTKKLVEKRIAELRR